MEEQYELIFVGSDFIRLPKRENYYMRYSNANENYTTICSALNESSLSCLSPKLQNVGEVSLSISINKIDFHLLPISILLIHLNDIHSISIGLNMIRVSQTPVEIAIYGIQVMKMF